MLGIDVTDYQTITLIITAGTLLWSTSKQVHTLKNIDIRVANLEEDVDELKALYPFTPAEAVRCLHSHGAECKSIIHGT